MAIGRWMLSTLCREPENEPNLLCLAIPVSLISPCLNNSRCWFARLLRVHAHAVTQQSFPELLAANIQADNKESNLQKDTATALIEIGAGNLANAQDLATRDSQFSFVDSAKFPLSHGAFHNYYSSRIDGGRIIVPIPRLVFFFLFRTNSSRRAQGFSFRRTIVFHACSTTVYATNSREYNS